MTTNAKDIVYDIYGSLQPGDVAYINRNGTWDIGKDGCQPAYTQAVSYDDFEECTRAEIEDNVEEFFARWEFLSRLEKGV